MEKPAGRHVDILGKHLSESTYFVVDLAGESHVECSGGEFFKTHLASAYAACGKERRHRKIDGFLRIGE